MRPWHFGDFYRDVEWMGLQRHLRILGIFARLSYRDDKPMYLAEAPRFVNYVAKPVSAMARCGRCCGCSIN